MSGKIYNGDTRVKVFVGDTKIKHVYAGDRQVYSSGSTVTYWVGPSTSYTEEVDEGASCLNPSSFTPTMSGWTFHGWREDTTASATVLSTKTMGDTPVTLYAVFKKTVTVSYNGNSSTGGSTSNSTGTAYKNAMGNTLNASISIRANGYTRTNYTYYRWGTSTSGGTLYKAGDTYSSINNLTLYAQWIATVVDFGYTGGVQTFAAKAGVTYQLKVWGAQGGSASSNVYVTGKGYYDVSGTGANGGYSVGNKAVTTNATWYVVVGGMGTSNYKNSGAITVNGGYNGGGSGKNTGGENRGAGGGGATHIGLSNALLKDTAQANVLIAAGGGGGAGVGGTRDDTHQSYITYGDAGTGGGTNGGNVVIHGTDKSSTWDEFYCNVTGGSQYAGGSASLGNNPGSYGQGGSGYAGGGGGLYGGGATGDYGIPAGGGSGYTGGVSSGSMSNGQQSGDGKAQIVVVSVS